MDILSVLTKLSSVILILLCLQTSYAIGQNNSDTNIHDEMSVLESTELIYGSDDLLVNGKIYYQQYPLAEGHPYFITNEWLNSVIFIKGRSFSGYEIKYDLDMDKIVLNTRDKKGAFVDLKLNHQVIDSLYILDHFFVNTNQFKMEKPVSNFFEVVYNDIPMLLVHHKKEFLEEFNERYPYGRYRDPAKRLYLFEENELTDVTKKKAFLNYYEPWKRDIKKYMKRNGIDYKKADNRALFLLMDYCKEECR